MVEDLNAMIGSTLLVGVTYLAADGEVEGVFELHGRVTSVDPLVTIERDGQEDFTLPRSPRHTTTRSRVSTPCARQERSS